MNPIRPKHLEIIDVIWSFDKVVFISRRRPQYLRELLPEELLVKHCIPNKPGKVVFSNRREKSRRSWWPSEVTGSACNDYYMKIMSDYDEVVLTELEVAQDVIFKTMEEAEQYTEWYQGIVERANNRHRFNYETTLYLGKQKGDKIKSFVRCYPRESKRAKMPCCHFEFVLRSARAIQRALKIKNHTEVISAMDSFNRLENNLLRYKGIRATKGTMFGSQYIPGAEYRRIRERMLG